MINDLEIRKSYYPSGKLRSERSFRKGIPHGCHRVWHENGVLASEEHLKDGVPDAVGRQWDEQGNLIVTYEIKNGTGIQKTWLPTQGLCSEIPWVNGKISGRQWCYHEDGTLGGENFWIRDKKVSKKRYLEACKSDPTLPQYEKEKKKCQEAPAIRPVPRADVVSAAEFEKIAQSKLVAGSAFEALSWLTEPSRPARSLGEASSQQDSIELIKELYGAGATKVWVIDVHGGPNEEQNSGRLLIELPTDTAERHSILAKCGEIGTELGFSPEPDVGQRYTLVMLD